MSECVAMNLLLLLLLFNIFALFEIIGSCYEEKGDTTYKTTSRDG